MRMNNPSMRRTLLRAQSGQMAVETRPATFGGIALKSVYYLGVTIVAAIAAALLLVYAVTIEDGAMLMTVLIAAGVSGIAMLVFSLIVMFAPKTVIVCGTLYSICQGFLLGLMSLLLSLVLPGVGFAAILGTGIVFLLSVVLNKFLSTRVKNAFMQVLFVGFFSLLAVELIVFIATLATGSNVFAETYFWIQLALTVFCVFYASVMLMWELQAANDVVQMGADKRYEWIVAFSLSTTLVYLYIEIMELLVRFALIFGKRK